MDPGRDTVLQTAIVVVLLVHIVCFAALCRSGGSWPGRPDGVHDQRTHGIGRNFMHQADNLWMRVCTVGGWNIHLNRVSHAISHHDAEHRMGLKSWAMSRGCSTWSIDRRTANGFSSTVLYCAHQASAATFCSSTGNCRQTNVCAGDALQPTAALTPMFAGQWSCD